MASSPITRVITSSTPYTVPTGKYFLGSIVISGESGATLLATTPGGAAKLFSRLDNTGNLHGTLKPLVLTAGTVLSISGAFANTGNVLLSGFLFDA